MRCTRGGVHPAHAQWCAAGVEVCRLAAQQRAAEHPVAQDVQVLLSFGALYVAAALCWWCLRAEGDVFDQALRSK